MLILFLLWIVVGLAASFQQQKWAYALFCVNLFFSLVMLWSHMTSVLEINW